jgi:hypothetical protein
MNRFIVIPGHAFPQINWELVDHVQPSSSVISSEKGLQSNLLCWVSKININSSGMQVPSPTKPKKSQLEFKE